MESKSTVAIDKKAPMHRKAASVTATPTRAGKGRASEVGRSVAPSGAQESSTAKKIAPEQSDSSL